MVSLDSWLITIYESFGRQMLMYGSKGRSCYEPHIDQKVFTTLIRHHKSVSSFVFFIRGFKYRRQNSGGLNKKVEKFFVWTLYKPFF